MKTDDYRYVIDEIVKSEVIISSSLHGIILAEAYGVPVIPLVPQNANSFKYEDYFEGTGRKNVCFARTLEEAMKMNPIPSPDLKKLSNRLIDAFPVDMWLK